MYRDIVIKVLTNVPIFKDISNESVDKLACLAKLNQYPKGATVFNEGDPGDCLYIIASGKIEIYTRTASGEEIKLKTLGVAEVFGEMALLDGLPRSATVRVGEKAILFYISRIDFNLFLMQNPDVSLKLIETVSRRLRDTNKRLKDMTDENEGLKIALQETYSFIGEKTPEISEDDRYFTEEYICPCCDSPISSLKVKNKFVELNKTDNDLCPHYRTANPLFYEMVVCSHCGYAFNDDTFEKLSPQVKNIFHEKLRRLGKPPECSGRRNLDQALLTFHQAFQLHDDRNIAFLARANICLKLAWLYRYKEDHENERKYLVLARQRFMEAYEEDKYGDPQKVIHLMYMTAMTCKNTGDPAEALKWLARIIQHPQRDQASKLVEKARELWLDIRQGPKKRN